MQCRNGLDHKLPPPIKSYLRCSEVTLHTGRYAIHTLPTGRYSIHKKEGVTVYATGMYTPEWSLPTSRLAPMGANLAVD